MEKQVSKANQLAREIENSADRILKDQAVINQSNTLSAVAARISEEKGHVDSLKSLTRDASLLECSFDEEARPLCGNQQVKFQNEVQSALNRMHKSRLNLPEITIAETGQINASRNGIQVVTDPGRAPKILSP